MKFQMKSTMAESVGVELQDSLSHLSRMIQAPNPEMKVFHYQGVEEEMGDSKIEAWFSLFIRFIFRMAYTEKDETFNQLQDIVKQNNAAQQSLTWLRQEAQVNDNSKKIIELKKERSDLMRRSYSGGLDLLMRDEAISKELKTLEQQIQPILNLLLVAEKIILILSTISKVELACFADVKSNPLPVIVNLMPIIKLLQTGEVEKLEEVIKLTLQLVKIEETSLITPIKEQLFKEWIELAPPSEVKKESNHPSFNQKTVLPPILTRPVGKATDDADELDLQDSQASLGLSRLTLHSPATGGRPQTAHHRRQRASASTSSFSSIPEVDEDQLEKEGTFTL